MITKGNKMEIIIKFIFGASVASYILLSNKNKKQGVKNEHNRSIKRS